MGKHFWVRDVGDKSHDRQPGCIWGFVQVLDYHHWHSSVKKLMHHSRHEGQTQSESGNRSPRTKMNYDNAVEDSEKLLDEKETKLSAKRSRTTKKRSLRARIKAWITEESSKERKEIQSKEGSSLKSSLQRTYSIHHLEALDDGLGNIIFFPRNVENCANQSVDTTQMKAADSTEDTDVLEIFRVDKELLIKHLQDADEDITNFSRSALGSNMEPRFSKSRSYPVAGLSERRKLKPMKLENKQREVWPFPRQDTFQTLNQAPKLDNSSYIHRRSGDIDELPDKPWASKRFEDIPDSKAESTMDRVGEKPKEYDLRKSTHRQSYSLIESLDKYARLFGNSFRTDAKLQPSSSLRLTNEYSRAPAYFRRIHSVSSGDSYYSGIKFEILGEDSSGNGYIVKAEDTSPGLQNSEEEVKIARSPINDTENLPLYANDKDPVDRCNSMEMKETDANLTLHTSNDDREQGECHKEVANELKNSALLDQETDSSEVIKYELPDQGLILHPGICLQEAEFHALEHQISEGLEHKSSHFADLNSSVESNDLKSLHSKSMSADEKLNLENDEKLEVIIKCTWHDECPKKNDFDLYYVRELLDQAGIAVDQPLSECLFEEVEAYLHQERDQLTGWPDFYGCWHHRMLFDLVNEVLLDVYNRSLPCYHKPLSSTCRVLPFPQGNHIIDEVSKSISSLLNLKPEDIQYVDCIVSHDLSHDNSWMNLQLESETVVLELEDMILHELLEEAIYS